MPRHRLRRRIRFFPALNGFVPITEEKTSEQVMLTLEEVEALRLKDLLGLSESKAAERMNVSQPTFHRIVKEARKKIADALVNNKKIKIGGGVYEMVGKAKDLAEQLKDMPIRARGRRGFGGPPTYCVCPVCGNKQPKVPGVPCAMTRCNKCGALMVRGD